MPIQDPEGGSLYWIDGDTFDGLQTSSPPDTSNAQFWIDGDGYDAMLPEPGDGSSPADGSAAGVATAAAVGVGIHQAAGSAAGTGTATGVGQAIVAGVGSAAGVGSGAGVASAAGEGVGSAAGVATVTGVGVALSTEGAGSAEGAGVAAAVGVTIAAGTGSSAGVATVGAEGAGIHQAVGSAEGAGVASGAASISITTGGEVGGTEPYTYTPVDYTQADFTPRRNPAITIHDQIDDSPNSATYDEDAVEPLLGQQVTVDFGDGVLFKGPIQVVTEKWEGQRDQRVWSVQAIDFTWFLNRKRPFGTFNAVSATDVVLELMSTYAPTFDVSGVEAGMPSVTVVFDGSQDMASALTTIASLIDGHWRLEDEALVFATEEVADNPADIDDENFDLLRSPQIEITRDATQIRTRVLVRGSNASLAAAAVAGDTELDLDSIDIFSTSGGTVLIGTDRLAYSSKEARVIVTTPEGQQPDITGRAAALGVTYSPGGGTFVNDDSDLVVVSTFIYADGSESNFSQVTLANGITPSAFAYPSALALTGIPVGGSNEAGYPTAGRKIYIGVGGSTRVYYPWTFIGDNVTTAGSFSKTSTGGGTSNTIAPGPTGPGGVLTITEGAALTDGGFAPGDYRFSVSAVYADGTESLLGSSVTVNLTGTNLLDVDVSAISAPDVNGVTAAFFHLWTTNTDGDTTHIGNIPLAGATIAFFRRTDDSPITSVPAAPTIETRYFLIGVDVLPLDYPVGTAVSIFEVIDDPTAQAELAVTEGGDGVHEFYIAGDYQSKGIARAAGAANLALHARPIVTVRYATRDPKTKAGKTVVFNLSNPPINETLKIQEVTIDQIHEADDLTPRYLATASTIRFTFDDLMKKILEAN